MRFKLKIGDKSPIWWPIDKQTKNLTVGQFVEKLTGSDSNKAFLDGIELSSQHKIKYLIRDDDEIEIRLEGKANEGKSSTKARNLRRKRSKLIQEGEGENENENEENEEDENENENEDLQQNGKDRQKHTEHNKNSTTSDSNGYSDSYEGISEASEDKSGHGHDHDHDHGNNNGNSEQRSKFQFKPEKFNPANSFTPRVPIVPTGHSSYKNIHRSSVECQYPDYYEAEIPPYPFKKLPIKLFGQDNNELSDSPPKEEPIKKIRAEQPPPTNSTSSSISPNINITSSPSASTASSYATPPTTTTTTTTTLPLPLVRLKHPELPPSLPKTSEELFNIIENNFEFKSLSLLLPDQVFVVSELVCESPHYLPTQKHRTIKFHGRVANGGFLIQNDKRDIIKTNGRGRFELAIDQYTTPLNDEEKRIERLSKQFGYEKIYSDTIGQMKIVGEDSATKGIKINISGIACPIDYFIFNN